MSIQFKFRSSVNYDSVDIDGRSSISVKELRSKILEQKSLKISGDFDLLISDAITGLEYDDENLIVPSGSSLIIKRVAAGRTAPSSALPHNNAVENVGIKQIHPVHTIQSSPSPNVDVENFDDFGVDLYPAMGGSLLYSDVDVDKMDCIGTRVVDYAIRRCSEPSIARHQNLESSDLSEANQRGAVDCGVKGNISQRTLKLKMEDVVDSSSPAMPKLNLPSELRCSLCNTIFKEAVMIPCCQHSFCEKCIHLVLVEKERCPKCLSTKCNVGDLLPNVSLRQAIEHFLESQILMSGSDNLLPKYAPDGESGIQAKEVSCAMSIRQRETLLPHSPSGTGKGSNQVVAESAYESVTRNNGVAANGSRIIRLNAVGKSVKLASSSQKIKPMKNLDQYGVASCHVNHRAVSEGLDSLGEYQGENQPLSLPRTLMHTEEANSTTKKKGPWVDPVDGVGSFATAKYRKGDRACYKCGSPDHLIRDCRAASGQYPMLQTAYGPPYSPYWHGASFPHTRPFGNMYAASGVMPFTPTMIPVAPLRVPSYVSPLYGGLSMPCGLMRMGGFTPQMVTGAKHPVSQAELMELQDSERLYEHPKRKFREGDLDESGYYCEPQLSHDWNTKLDENSESYSEHYDTQRKWKKPEHYKHHPDEGPHLADRRKEKGSISSAAGRDHFAHHTDVSSSELQDMSDTSDWRSKERHKHHQRTPKKHRERREHGESDSSRRSHHKSPKEPAMGRKRSLTDSKRHSQRHHNQSDSGLEPRSSGDQKRQPKVKDSSHSSRPSRHKMKATDELTHERWEMVDGLDEDPKEDYHRHCKRKRRH